MTIAAVVFDLGGVLERIAPDRVWLEPWGEHLGLDVATLEARLAAVDSEGGMVGDVSEAEYARRCTAALGLTREQQGRFFADMWDAYCGELDSPLVAFAAGLRPQHTTAILSNSADGARREEEAHHGLSARFDPIIYSHEVGLRKPDPQIYALTCERLALAPAHVVLLDDVPENVEAARESGLHAVHHTDTGTSIGALQALLAR